jgi:endonuclease-8
VRLGRIVTTDPDEIGRPRSRMRAEDRLYVYHRDHCRRCGTELGVLELGGRPIWFCPTCQPR